LRSAGDVGARGGHDDRSVGAVGLGREAVDRGYTVLFTSAAALMAGLTKAHADGRLEEKLLQLSKPKLLIIDEPGTCPSSQRRRTCSSNWCRDVTSGPAC